MNAMSIRRDSRSPCSPPDEGDGRRPRTFLCREDLYRAFEGRANELECSVDWLLAEAMKRLLKDARLELPPRVVAPSLRPPSPEMRVPPVTRRLPPTMMGPPLLPVPPPPPPSRGRKPTGSYVGDKAALTGRIALRLGDVRVVVDRDRFVIGRSAKDAAFPIRDPNVSRQHAIIERGPGGTWTVVDMASTNGVLLNRSRVTRASIRPGDVIEIGPFAIVVERA